MSPKLSKLSKLSRACLHSLLAWASALALLRLDFEPEACLHRQLHKTKFCTYFLKAFVLIVQPGVSLFSSTRWVKSTSREQSRVQTL